MRSDSPAIDTYLANLPAERREALQALRALFDAHLDPALEEGVQYGMIGYYVPHAVYPDGYHCDPKQPVPFASLASQKNHIGVYLFCIYADPSEQARFEAEWKKTGKKLDMGKACVRFKRIEDAALDVLAATLERTTVARFLEFYEAGLRRTGKGASKRSAPKKAAPTMKGAAKARAAKASTKKTTAKKKTNKATTAVKSARKATRATPRKKAGKR